MTSRHRHRAPWSVTTQRLLLEELTTNTCGKMFVPCTDQTSRAGFRSGLSSLFTNSVGFIEILYLWPVILPVYAAYWIWRRRQPASGWLLDMDRRCLQSVRQKQAQTHVLTPEMGLLAHHRQIDITHPTRGPILTLFSAASSADPQDTLAMQQLAMALADQLQLRLVGCRVALN